MSNPYLQDDPIVGNTLKIYPNGDWCVFKPYATGIDCGPAHYGKKPHGRDADAQIPFYTKAGFRIDDRRMTTAT